MYYRCSDPWWGLSVLVPLVPIEIHLTSFTSELLELFSLKQGCFNEESAVSSPILIEKVWSYTTSDNSNNNTNMMWYSNHFKEVSDKDTFISSMIPTVDWSTLLHRCITLVDDDDDDITDDGLLFCIVAASLEALFSRCHLFLIALSDRPCMHVHSID